jgi:hypothetical protein
VGLVQGGEGGNERRREWIEKGRGEGFWVGKGSGLGYADEGEKMAISELEENQNTTLQNYRWIMIFGLK